MRNEIGLADYDGEAMSITNAKRAIHQVLVYVTTSRVKDDGAKYVASYLTKCEIIPPNPHVRWSEAAVRECWDASDATLLQRSKANGLYQNECDRVKKEIGSKN